MFGIGFLEICIICTVALVFIGPQKLPELMVQAGKFFVQIRRMSNEVKSTVDRAVEDAEITLDEEARIIKQQGSQEAPPAAEGLTHQKSTQKTLDQQHL